MFQLNVESKSFVTFYTEWQQMTALWNACSPGSCHGLRINFTGLMTKGKDSVSGFDALLKTYYYYYY